MTDLSLQDYAALTTRFYEAAIDDALWSETIAALKTRLQLSMVGLGWFNTAGGSDMLYGDCERQFTELFRDLGRDNIFVPRMLGQPVGTVFQDQAVVSKAEFQRTVMYNEWFLPQDEHSALVLKVSAESGSHGFLILQRGGHRPAFAEADEEMVRLLGPSLIHALDIRRRLGLLRLQRQGKAWDAAAIGFVVTTAAGRVVAANETADQQFGEAQGLVVRAGRLVTEQPSGLGAAIVRAIAPSGTASRGSELIVTTGDDRHPAYALSVAPITDDAVAGLPGGRNAMIFIQPLNREVPAGFGARMQNLFGLTRREAALAAALASGKSLQQAAAGWSISMATVRTQLAQVFRKTNTTQQSQLVSLLRGIQPVGEI